MNPNLAYHPSWEPPFDYDDKNKYAQQLQAIANKKEGEYLMMENNSIRVVGTIMGLWQKIKGWLGFQNLADPIKVNYQILKMLRYGEEIHHYLDQDSIKQILRQIRESLSRQPQHADIAAFIQKTFLAGSAENSPEQLCTILDKEICVYYDRNSQSLLQEGFWSRYFPDLQDNVATIEYNRGRIKAVEGRQEASMQKLSEAAVSIENALAHAPHKSEWQISLAKLYLELADLQLNESSYASADQSCAHCIGHLIKIAKVNDEDLSKDIRDLLKQALVFQFAIAIKEGSEAKAFDILTKARGALATSAAEFLDEYYNHIIITNPEAFIGYKQLGDLLLCIAKKEKDPATSTQIFSKATDYLEQAYRDASQGLEDITPLQQSLKSLFELQQELAKRYLYAHHWVDAQGSLRKALIHFENYKAATSNVDLSPPVQEILQLAEHFKHEHEFDRALDCYEMAMTPACRAIAATLQGGVVALEKEVMSCHIALGEENTTAKRYEMAVDHFERAMRMNNISTEAARRIADGFVALGDALISSRNESEKEIALGCYNKALPLMQQDGERAEKLVMTLIKMADASKDKNTKDAIGFLEVAVQNAPQHLEIYGKLADCYKTEGNWAKAEGCLRALLDQAAQGPDEPQSMLIEDTYRGIADLCQRQSKFLQAAEAFSSAAHTGASSRDYEEEIFQNLMAHVKQLSDGKQYREALATCEEMLQKHPAKTVPTAAALLQIGSLMDAANDHVSAIRAYEDAAPHLEQLFYNEPAKQQQILQTIAQDARAHGNWVKAIKFYRTLLQLNNRDLKIILPLIDCLIAQPDYSGAESLIAQSLLRHVGNDELIYRSALLYKTMGLKEAAISKLTQALQAAPSKKAYLEELIQMEMEAADNYLKNGTSNPEKVYYDTSQLVSDIARPDTVKYSQFMFITEDVQNALAPPTSKTKSVFRPILKLMGFKSDYEKLVSCRNKPRSIRQVKLNGLQALNLIQTTYDGQPPNHKDHGEMPPELSYRVKKLQGMINGMDQYYADLQNAAKKMTEILQKNGIPNIRDWNNIALLDDLSNAEQIQNQAVKIMSQFDAATSSMELSPMLKEQIDLLRAMLDHQRSLQAAIAHYMNIYQKIPNQYGEHCNKLIEAFIENGQYEEAIKWFDTFYDKFPENQSSLYIDSKAYAAVFIALKLGKTKLSAEDVALMSKAAERFPNDQTLQGLPFFLFAG